MYLEDLHADIGVAFRVLGRMIRSILLPMLARITSRLPSTFANGAMIINGVWDSQVKETRKISIFHFVRNRSE